MVNILHTEAASHLSHLSQFALGWGWENISNPHSYLRGRVIIMLV